MFDSLFFSNLGKVLYLWSLSNIHSDCPVNLLNQYVYQPLQRKQFYILESSNGIPLVYISWAFLSLEAEVKYLSNPYSLTNDDWNSGDRIWFTDMISPFGERFTRELIDFLRNGLFSSKIARALRVKSGSSMAKVIPYWGANVSFEERKNTLRYLYMTAKILYADSKKIVWDR